MVVLHARDPEGLVRPGLLTRIRLLEGPQVRDRVLAGQARRAPLTTGTASTLYEPNGIDGDIVHVLWPIHNGTLAYTGLHRAAAHSGVGARAT